MDIFPPEDRPEFRQRHAGIDLEILRARPVELEGFRPRGRAERREETRDRAPIDDREPGFGQPGDAADNDHGEDHGGAHEQPVSDRAVVRALARIHRLGAGRCGHDLTRMSIAGQKSVSSRKAGQAAAPIGRRSVRPVRSRRRAGGPPGQTYSTVQVWPRCRRRFRSAEPPSLDACSICACTEAS